MMRITIYNDLSLLCEYTASGAFMAKSCSIVSFHIFHEGCWTTTLDGSCGDVSLVPINRRYDGESGYTETVLQARGRFSDLSSLYNRIRYHSGAAQIHRFRANGSDGAFRDEIWRIRIRLQNSISRILNSYDVVCSRNMYDSGVEKWKVLAPDDSADSMDRMVRTLESMGSISHLRIFGMDGDPRTFFKGLRSTLTDDDRRFAATLLNSGYFNYPRTKGLSEMAAITCRSKSALLQRIRMIEKKLLLDLLDD